MVPATIPRRGTLIVGTAPVPLPFVPLVSGAVCAAGAKGISTETSAVAAAGDFRGPPGCALSAQRSWRARNRWRLPAAAMWRLVRATAQGWRSMLPRPAPRRPQQRHPEQGYRITFCLLGSNRDFWADDGVPRAAIRPKLHRIGVNRHEEDSPPVDLDSQHRPLLAGVGNSKVMRLPCGSHH